MISLLKNKNIASRQSELTNHFDLDTAKKVLALHSTFPGYKPTPLVELKGLSNHLGLNKIWIKDESHRFGLNAFKVLGAGYAVINYLYEYMGMDNKPLSFSFPNDKKIENKIESLTLVTATDGNHGRGVAWTAQQIGCRSVIYMPKGTTQSRFENIKSLGADVTIIDGSYDAAVQLAKENSKRYGWLLVQDSSWNGYEKIPLMIMQGYLTIMKEIFDLLKGEIPTHVFVQCGVGSLPAAVAAFLVNFLKEKKPVFVVVEPDDAACMLESARLSSMITLKNEMKTIMAGLACGTPSKSAFDILSAHTDFFIKCPDEVTIKGMQILGRQEFGDPKIISGESGAVTTGLLYYLLSDKKFAPLSEELKLNSASKVLLISTEGDTDPVMYRKILDQIT
ncbi:MAG: diaminopropionate ammonia-lyase [Bacteroidota bacterium]